MKGYWIILGTAIVDAAAQAKYGALWRQLPPNIRPGW